jgi:hypothetical protein
MTNAIETTTSTGAWEEALGRALWGVCFMTGGGGFGWAALSELVEGDEEDDPWWGNGISTILGISAFLFGWISVLDVCCSLLMQVGCGSVEDSKALLLLGIVTLVFVRWLVAAIIGLELEWWQWQWLFFYLPIIVSGCALLVVSMSNLFVVLVLSRYYDRRSEEDAAIEIVFNEVLLSESSDDRCDKVADQLN